MIAIDKLSKAAKFIKPLLGWSNDFYEDLFVNCYITKNDKLIHLLLNRPLPNQLKVINEIRLSDSYIEDVSIGDYYLVTLQCPYHFEKDFTIFCEGRYSKMSDDAKNLIIFSYSNKNNIGLFSTVLFPQAHNRKSLEIELDCELPKDCEIYSRPKIDEDEELDFNMLKDWLINDKVGI